MAVDSPLHVWIGFDSREAVAAHVCKHSIQKRTTAPLSIEYLKHRDLRKRGLFSRTWITLGNSGEWLDPLDEKPFSTEFSHTRFLVPELMNFKGWALFMDCDMIFLSDIKKLFALCDDKYAVMCVHHVHVPPANSHKMDGREQLRYHRKNWSSFVLWNCGHPSNRRLTKEMVGFSKGSDLHAFAWLKDSEIGKIPYSYNFISGVSPKTAGMPDVVHYTDGGPWFEECQDVPYAGSWVMEFEDWQRNGSYVTDVPSMAFEREEIRK